MAEVELWTVWLIGLVSLALLIIFYWRLARIDAATARTVELIEALLGEAQGIGGKVASVQRDGIRLAPPTEEQPAANWRGHG